MNNLDLAKKIIELVGGRENVISVYHCVTRLRFQLKDWEKAKLSDLEKTEGILDAKFQSGEIQVIIGAGVGKVFASVSELLDLSGVQDMQEVQPQKQKKKINDRIHSILETIPGIFMPIVPAIAGTGLLKGLLAVISIFNLAPSTSETVQILSLISDCVFISFRLCWLTPVPKNLEQMKLWLSHWQELTCIRPLSTVLERGSPAFVGAADSSHFLQFNSVPDNFVRITLKLSLSVC